MKQEDKQLLLKSLCAMLPYGVKIWYKYYPDKITEQFATSIRLVDGKIALSRKFDKEGDWYPIEEANELLIKPYLRPMSSMTEEEKEEYNESIRKDVDVIIDAMKRGENSGAGFYKMDFLYSHHFDYYGLIPIGLALEAPEGMYK